MFGFKKKIKVEEPKKEVDYLAFAEKAIEYIKSRRLLGISDDTIKKEMSKNKYPDTLIDYLFNRLDCSDKPKTLSFEEEVFRTLGLGKKHLLKYKKVNLTFKLMEDRLNKKLNTKQEVLNGS